MIMNNLLYILLLSNLGSTILAGVIEGPVQAHEDVDYAIIGAGTAGCIVAARLVEAGYKVFVFEAGRDAPNSTDTNRLSHTYYKTEVDWQFETETQQHALYSKPDRKEPIAAGKLMGGSGSINAMIFLRGSKHDYDKWEELGASGWKYEEILPYLKKVEKSYLTNVDPNNHGNEGKISISDKESQEIPLIKAFVDSVEKSGVVKGDPSDGENDKVGFMPFNFYENQRQSTWRKYLEPLLEEHNKKKLYIHPGTHVKKIIFDDNKKAIGVIFDQGVTKNITIKLKREVIVCAGVINTPQVLMLSGIGPKDELENHGIDLLSDRPVGKNLIDHMSVTFRPFKTEESHPISAATAFIKSDDSQSHSDIQIFHATFGGLDFAYTILLQAESRGEIKLRSNNPFDKVIIDPKYLSNENDRKRFANGVRKHVQIMNSMEVDETKYTKNGYQYNETCKDYEEWGDEHLQCVLKYDAYRAHHMVGTARMGGIEDANSVVDPELKVIGVSGVRVVDASVMPTIVSANTQSAVMAIAEKAAALILNEAQKQTD